MLAYLMSVRRGPVRAALLVALPRALSRDGMTAFRTIAAGSSPTATRSRGSPNGPGDPAEPVLPLAEVLVQRGLDNR